MENKELYKKICAERNVPVFLQWWWMDIVCAQWDVAIATKGEQVTGVWPYPVELKANVSLLRTPVLTPYMGPHVFFPADVKESNRDGFEHETITALIKQLPNAKVWHLTLQPGMKQAGLFKSKKLEAQAQQTFLIDLLPDEAAIFANMKETMRRNIRSAEKAITITHEPEHLKDLYNFQKHTLTGKGKELHYSYELLQQLMKACTNHNAGTLLVAKKDGVVQAIVWQVWDAHNSYYFMGGQNPKGDSYKATSALLWDAMKNAKQQGCKTFDLEGSMDEGVERFFRGFGGVRQLYLVLRKNESLLWKMKEMLRG